MDLQRLLPPYWVQNYPTNLEWDRTLNDLLDTNPVVKFSYMTVSIGAYEIWVSNWPYAYGHIYGPSRVDVLPKVGTRKRLRNYLVTQGIKQSSAV